jgi:hypothetical protein
MQPLLRDERSLDGLDALATSAMMVIVGLVMPGNQP